MNLTPEQIETILAVQISYKELQAEFEAGDVDEDEFNEAQLDLGQMAFEVVLQMDLTSF